MNILMVCINFYPSVGGLEIVTENLATEFVKLGHKVTIITNTPYEGTREFPFKVLRRPSISETYKVYKSCDVFVHQTISLKYVWPLLLRRKPWFVVYHQVHWEKGMKGKIKRLFSCFSKNICVSNTTVKGYELKKTHVIYNAYNNEVFKNTNKGERKDIVFVGRLCRDKGIYLLIEAFNEFKELTKSDYQLHIVGDSQERTEIEKYAITTKYNKSIYFLGTKSSSDIASILNEHHILAVTSTHPYYEAFGIVVLEGLACGCTVIGADGDGIEEALNGCGVLYKNGNKQSLVKALTKAYKKEQCFSKEKEKWLFTREKNNVAKQYIEFFESTI